MRLHVRRQAVSAVSSLSPSQKLAHRCEIILCTCFTCAKIQHCASLDQPVTSVYFSIYLYNFKVVLSNSYPGIMMFFFLIFDHFQRIGLIAGSAQNRRLSKEPILNSLFGHFVTSKHTSSAPISLIESMKMLNITQFA